MKDTRSIFIHLIGLCQQLESRGSNTFNWNFPLTIHTFEWLNRERLSTCFHYPNKQSGFNRIPNAMWTMWCSRNVYDMRSFSIDCNKWCASHEQCLALIRIQKRKSPRLMWVWWRLRCNFQCLFFYVWMKLDFLMINGIDWIVEVSRLSFVDIFVSTRFFFSHFEFIYSRDQKTFRSLKIILFCVQMVQQIQLNT